MRKQMIILLAAVCTTSVTNGWAQQKAAQQNEKLTFTTVVKNPITPVKNQSRSGTCWDYATIGFFESEILRETGRTLDLCEMFVANKNYMDEAIYHVRLNGDSRFSEGGSADDVLAVLRQHGICPEEAMPAPGTLTGDSLANFTEFFSVLTPYVEAVARSKERSCPPNGSKAIRPSSMPISANVLRSSPMKAVATRRSRLPRAWDSTGTTT